MFQNRPRFTQIELSKMSQSLQSNLMLFRRGLVVSLLKELLVKNRDPPPMKLSDLPRSKTGLKLKDSAPRKVMS